MSSILTWQSSGLGAKTGTAINNLVDDLVSLFNSKLGDATFAWQVASSNNASSPYYVVLKRKDGSVGRILLVCWTSLPAGNHATLCVSGAPANGGLHSTYFPNGNADVPSALSATSGTILGDDTGALYLAPALPVASVYAGDYRLFYFDCEAGILLCWQNPAAGNTMHCCFAGDLVVDASDNAYPCSGASGNGNMANFAASTSSPFTYVTAVPGTSTATPRIRTNYGGVNSVAYSPFAGFGAWASQGGGVAEDVLQDSATGRAWFVPYPLIIHGAKGGGFPIKLRQIAIGPNANSAFQVKSISGPVVQARHACAATDGGTTHPWVVNFKL